MRALLALVMALLLCALRPADAYPLWYVFLRDAQGDAWIGHAYVSATTGEALPE